VHGEQFAESVEVAILDEGEDPLGGRGFGRTGSFDPATSASVRAAA
jgi:hypothetical protein